MKIAHPMTQLTTATISTQRKRTSRSSKRISGRTGGDGSEPGLSSAAGSELGSDEFMSFSRSRTMSPNEQLSARARNLRHRVRADVRPSLDLDRALGAEIGFAAD